MNKRGAEKATIAAIVIAVVMIALVFLVPNVILDGRAMAPPPVIHPQPGPSHECGNGDCESGEDYYSCCQDCCGEENDQVASQGDCCEGLTAVGDQCERPVQRPCKEEEGGPTIPVLPPSPPPSTDAVLEPTGYAVAPPPTTPIECWFCVNCGDGKCSEHENGDNCPEDCAVCGNGICEPPTENYQNCPEDCCVGQGERAPAPVKCCEGLKAINPCDVDPQPDYCMITVMQEACINCGDGKCELYETPKNCPQDCLANVTECSELPQLEMNALDRKNTIKFTWEPAILIPDSDLYLQESNKCIGENCEFGPEMLISAAYQPSQPGEYSIDMPQDNLQFYQIKAKIRVGPKGANCEPQCLFKNTKGEGFYDPCIRPEPKLFKYDETCSEKKVSCCFVGTRSEGFYEVDCKDANENNLISYDNTCHLGAKLCEQPSNLMVKYTQEFERPTSYERITATGVNWMWYINIEGVKDTEDLLNMGGVFDYVAYWDAEQQRQVGSAKGNPQLVCKPCGNGVCCSYEYVITGKFDLEKGKNYFVSLSEGLEGKDIIYVGDVPEPIKFELKKVSNKISYNYIALPFNTEIKQASQICNDPQLGMTPDETIGVWDTNRQGFYNPANGQEGRVACRVVSIMDFDVYPGQVYEVSIPKDTEWTQR